MLATLIIAAGVTIHVGCLVVADRLTRMFVFVLLLSHVYFCVGAYFYWVGLRDREFAGWVWSAAALDRALIILSVATTCVAVLVTIVNGLRYRPPRPLWQEPELNIRVGALKFISLLSVSCGLFVLAIGRVDGSPFILVAYQLSDMLVPCILFALALGRKYRRLSLILSLYFIIYAVMVGFRYKLAMVILPIALWLFFGSSFSHARKIILCTIGGIATLILFSIMTIYRVKFGGGLDFARGDASIDSLIYGLFAESNIIFGMVSIIGRFVDAEMFYYVDPIIDAIKELIPRFLFPGRTSGLYISEIQDGLMSEEGRGSGTAYPFVGEFAIMGGYTGMVIGTLAYALLYCWLHSVIVRISPSESLMRMGVALLAMLMGYYHYSRGYISQVNKAYIFVFLPYVLLCLQARGRLRKLLATSMTRTLRPPERYAAGALGRPRPAGSAAMAED